MSSELISLPGNAVVYPHPHLDMSKSWRDIIENCYSERLAVSKVTVDLTFFFKAVHFKHYFKMPLN